MTNKGDDAAEVQRQEDDLDRWRFAAEIVEVVLATPSDWSARIGIFGKWGEGKTTVLRFAESMLRDKGSVVFTFSPWAIQNWNDLWEDFGNRLSEALDTAGIPVDHSWIKTLKASGKWLESRGVGRLAEGVAVPERVAMRIGGWKTRSILDRYNIVDENDLRVAVQKYQAAQKLALEAIEAEKIGSLAISLEAAPSECVSAEDAGEHERVN